MVDVEFRVPIGFEYIATFSWAASGALVGIRKHYDVVGVFTIALIASTGGGMLRDGLFFSRTPSVLTDFYYLPIILAATLLMCLLAYRFGRRAETESVQKLVDVIDAVGTPTFAVYGMQLAQDYGIPIPGVLLVGVLNGVGGGLLRDVVVRDVPALLRPGQFSSLTLLFVCVLFLVLTKAEVLPPYQAAWWVAGIFVVIRLLTVRFNWQTRSVLPPDLRPGNNPPPLERTNEP